jgi:hypothetical protein
MNDWLLFVFMTQFLHHFTKEAAKSQVFSRPFSSDPLSLPVFRLQPASTVFPLFPLW